MPLISNCIVAICIVPSSSIKPWEHHTRGYNSSPFALVAGKIPTENVEQYKRMGTETWLSTHFSLYVCRATWYNSKLLDLLQCLSFFKAQRLFQTFHLLLSEYCSNIYSISFLLTSDFYLICQVNTLKLKEHVHIKTKVILGNCNLNSYSKGRVYFIRGRRQIHSFLVWPWTAMVEMVHDDCLYKR